MGDCTRGSSANLMRLFCNNGWLNECQLTVNSCFIYFNNCNQRKWIPAIMNPDITNNNFEKSNP